MANEKESKTKFSSGKTDESSKLDDLRKQRINQMKRKNIRKKGRKVVLHISMDDNGNLIAD